MNLINQSAFLKALGWALFDSLWQMGVLWLLYVVLTGNGKRFLARQRHSLAVLSLIGGSLWFLITLILHYQQADITTLFISVEVLQNSSFKNVFTLVEPVFPFLSLVYLGVIGYLFIRFFRQYQNTQNLFSSGIYKANPELRIFLKQIAAHMGIKKNVQLWLSDLVDTPLTIGFWKPVILLPVAAINQLSIQQAEAIILHELYHIKRNDYLINLLIACMDILLFFNPFVRAFTNILKTERENSCDDMVLQFRYEAGQYAKALLLLEKNRVKLNTLTIAATGKSKQLLLNRVKRILDKESSGSSVNNKLVAYFFSTILIAFIGWYNPGKVIVKTTAEPKIETPLVSTESNATFITPAADKRIKHVQTSKRGSGSDKFLIPLTSAEIFQQLVNWSGEENTEYVTAENEVSETQAIYPSYVQSFSETRDFSISESDMGAVALTVDAVQDVHPYVPVASFSYHITEDTALPKKHIVTYSEQKAKESLEKTLKGLQEIDWQKLEKELNASGKKVDIIKLQNELKKAIAEVDWKKVNEEAESSLIQAEEGLLKDHSALRNQLQKFQKDRQIQLDKIQKTKNTIILDRLDCEKARKVEEEKKNNGCTQKKKIVYI